MKTGAISKSVLIGFHDDCSDELEMAKMYGMFESVGRHASSPVIGPFQQRVSDAMKHIRTLNPTK